jgi:hypothetical protein
MIDSYPAHELFLITQRENRHNPILPLSEAAQLRVCTRSGLFAKFRAFR